MKNTKYDIEQRLIQFSVDVIKICKKTEKNYASEHLVKQIVRSSTSAALNYGEAQSAESTRDFQHKMKLCLKELRESMINMKIQKQSGLVKDSIRIDKLINENDQLISIFVASIKTATSKIKNP